MKSIKKFLNQFIVPTLTLAIMITLQNEGCFFFLGDGHLDSPPDEHTEENLLKLLKEAK